MLDGFDSEDDSNDDEFADNIYNNNAQRVDYPNALRTPKMEFLICDLLIKKLNYLVHRSLDYQTGRTYFLVHMLHT